MSEELVDDTTELIVDPPKVEDPPKDDLPPETVSREKYVKTSRDMLKYKNQTREQQDEIAELKQQAADKDTERLESKEEYKKLYLTTKEELERTKKDKETLVSNVYLNEKLGQIESAARKAGMSEDQVRDLSLYPDYIDMVETETTERGRIVVHGVSEMMEKVRVDRPLWFSKGKAPNMNASQPGVVTKKTLTPAEVSKMQKDEPAKYKEYMKAQYGLS